MDHLAAANRVSMGRNYGPKLCSVPIVPIRQRAAPCCEVASIGLGWARRDSFSGDHADACGASALKNRACFDARRLREEVDRNQLDASLQIMAKASRDECASFDRR